MSNKEKIYSLVKNHFALSEESLAIFKEKLFNPVVDEGYAQFGLDENQRKYWEISESYYSSIDRGWKSFRQFFPSFIEHYNVSYEDFRENKINDENKNRVKILKAMCKFYIDHKERGIANITGTAGYFEQIFEEFKDGRYSSYGIPNLLIDMYKDGKAKNYKDEDIIKSFISRVVKNDLDYIGQSKLPNKKMYLVLSCNFEDWFFCSTGENWSSCLGFNSNYFYWAGLPGLITDTNRAMIYITDKEQKRPIQYNDYYKEVEVDRIISRAWVLLGSEDYLNIVRFYPVNVIDIEGIQKIINYNKVCFSNSGKGGFISKNDFRLLYYKNGIANTIYYDETCLDLVDADKAGEKKTFKHLFQNGSGTCSYNSHSECFITGSDVITACADGLFDMVMYNKTLESGFVDDESCRCVCCGEVIAEGRGYETEDGTVCYSCFQEDYVTCTYCGDAVNINESCMDNNTDEFYCSSCFESLFTRCDECGEYFSNEAINYVDNLSMDICDNCLNEHYIVCDECEEYVKKTEVVCIDDKCFCSDCAENKKEEAS